MNAYQKAGKRVLSHFKWYKEDTQAQLVEWKKSLLTTQLEKSRLILKYTDENGSGKEALDPEQDIRGEKVSTLVKPFVDRLSDQIAFHEPHCSNYRLYRSKLCENNRFAIDIEDNDGGSEHLSQAPASDHESSNESASALDI